MMKTRQMVWRMGAAFLIVASCALGADEDALPDLDMDWLATGSIGDDSSPWSGITPVGRVTRVDGEYIESEDRVAGTRERRERAPGAAILLKLHGSGRTRRLARRFVERVARATILARQRGRVSLRILNSTNVLRAFRLTPT